ncbi:MAG TPA: hypothetical protein DHV85_18835 [Candidatus Accumulibacter sp.]|nr:hypothetical protein [Accumulibacter sp.]
MSEPRPVYDAPRSMTSTQTQIAHYMQMRAYTIRYLKMLEDELVAVGGLRPSDRACLTREERRALARQSPAEGQENGQQHR